MTYSLARESVWPYSQHTSAYVSIRQRTTYSLARESVWPYSQHTSAYVSIHQRTTFSLARESVWPYYHHLITIHLPLSRGLVSEAEV